MTATVADEDLSRFDRAFEDDLSRVRHLMSEVRADTDAVRLVSHCLSVWAGIVEQSCRPLAAAHGSLYVGERETTGFVLASTEMPEASIVEGGLKRKLREQEANTQSLAVRLHVLAGLLLHVRRYDTVEDQAAALLHLLRAPAPDPAPDPSPAPVSPPPVGGAP
jgi:hypothetical protein